MKATLDRYFHISERGSSIGTELRAGTVSFFAMAYIILLNPLILGTTEDAGGYALGVPQVAAATALVAGVMSILFGAIAKYPFAMAAGLGMNTFVGVSMVATSGLTWQESMGLVVIEGIIIVLLAISGFRTAVFDAIPQSMKAAMGVGIGMFIATIGLVDAGFVRRVPDAAMTTVPVQLGTGGSISSWPTLVFILGLFICAFMVVRGVRGGLFIGIVITTVIAMVVERLTGAGSSADNPGGWSLAVPSLPDSLGGIPDLSIVGDVDLFGAFVNVGVISASLLVFTLVLANFFDAMGTMTGLARSAGLQTKDGMFPRIRSAFVIEGLGAVAGGGVVDLHAAVAGDDGQVAVGGDVPFDEVAEGVGDAEVANPARRGEDGGGEGDGEHVHGKPLVSSVHGVAASLRSVALTMRGESCS